jgi:methylaspartate mutase sigma subunit
MSDLERFGPDDVRPEQGEAIVSSMASDSHTWNLIYLQLLLEDLGHPVTNLGACVPDELLVTESELRDPGLIVLSSVNGHGYQDGLRVVGKLRERPALADTPIVIGGKLGTSGPDPEHTADLLDAGFDAVYEDDPQEPSSFESFVQELLAPERRELGSGEAG